MRARGHSDVLRHRMGFKERRLLDWRSVSELHVHALPDLVAGWRFAVVMRPFV
jgi:hypothetical protein